MKILEIAALFSRFLMVHDFFHAARRFWSKNCQPDSRFARPVARTGANYDTRNSISFFSPFSQFFLSSGRPGFVPATVNLIGINFSPRISSSGRRGNFCKVRPFTQRCNLCKVWLFCQMMKFLGKN